MAVLKTVTQFHRKYKMTSLLGKGGYGSVYVCVEIRSKILRAVKVIDDSRSCSNKAECPKRKRAMPNEILLLEPLSHPNINRLLDVYFDDTAKQWYLIMEYDPGYEDLFSYVDANGPMTTRDCSRVVQQLVKVIQYLAAQGIDHRDIKDENILYSPKAKQIKLIDFGSAAKLSPEPYIRFRGTDVYIPPEYYHNRKYWAFPATVWAIGCLSFVLLHGDCPFDDREAVKSFKTMSDFHNPKFLAKTKRLDFIRQCLNPNPKLRMQFSELLDHAWLKLKT